MCILLLLKQKMLQATDRTSNDGAESVEAKQGASWAEDQNLEDAGINLDAESVHAREEGSEDDSDMEEGEIHGRHSCSVPAATHLPLVALLHSQLPRSSSQVCKALRSGVGML